MVHALGSVHKALRPGGVLVDIRPLPGDRPGLEVHAVRDRLATPCGFIDETDDGIEYRLAAAAAEFAVASGRFDLEDRWQIEFRRYAPSLDDLLAYFTDQWTDAVIAADTQQHIRETMAAAPEGSELVTREQVLVSRLVARGSLRLANAC
jgi:hypothetical protein